MKLKGFRLAYQAVRKYSQVWCDVAMNCKRDSDGRKIDHQSLQTMRMQAVDAEERGQRAAEVAVAFGMNELTVYRSLAAFAEGGQNALRDKLMSGEAQGSAPALAGEHGAQH